MLHKEWKQLITNNSCAIAVCAVKTAIKYSFVPKGTKTVRGKRVNTQGSNCWKLLTTVITAIQCSNLLQNLQLRSSKRLQNWDKNFLWLAWLHIHLKLTLASSPVMRCTVKRPFTSYSRRKFSPVFSIETTSRTNKTCKAYFKILYKVSKMMLSNDENINHF